MRDAAARMRKPISGLTPAAERLLLTARWDGNVRELKNVVERACMLSDGTLVSERELAGALRAGAGRQQPERRLACRAEGARRSRSAGGAPAPLEGIERDHILDVLRQVNGNRMAAAKLLGISRRALYRRLERHNLADEAPSPGGKRS